MDRFVLVERVRAGGIRFPIADGAIEFGGDSGGDEVRQAERFAGLASRTRAAIAASHARSTLHPQQSLSQERLHVAAAVGDQVDKHGGFDSPVDDPIGRVDDLPIAAFPNGIEFRWDRTALGKARQRFGLVEQRVDQFVRFID